MLKLVKDDEVIITTSSFMEVYSNILEDILAQGGGTVSLHDGWIIDVTTISGTSKYKILKEE